MVAQRALAILYNETVLGALVYRDYDQDFAGQVGDTVNVRVPAVFTAEQFNRSAGITVQDAKEQSFPITLDNIIDVSFAVTSEQLLLDIDDFAVRLLAPAMEAVNQGVDAALADELITAANQAGVSGGDYPSTYAGGSNSANGGVCTTNDTAEPLKALVCARVRLGRAKLPTLNRAAVISPEAAGQALSGDLIVQANTRGDTDGLIEASIGRKFGFDTYESQVLGDNKGGSGRHAADGVAFHQDAIALATRVMEVPLGKRDSAGDTVGVAIETYKSLGLRVVYDYDIHYKQDVVSIDFLYGCRAVRPQAAVELDLGVS
jgi:hypothetical protein